MSGIFKIGINRILLEKCISALFDKNGAGILDEEGLHNDDLRTH